MKCFWFTFLSFLLWTLLLCGVIALEGCRPSQEILIERYAERDTLYLDRFHYDSVYIAHDVFTDRTKETLYVKEKDIEVRYKLIHDSIRVVCIDSIPYTVTITKREEIPRHRNWFDWLSYSALAILTIYALYRLKRSKLK